MLLAAGSWQPEASSNLKLINFAPILIIKQWQKTT